MQPRHAALGVLLGLVIVGGVQLYGDSTPGATEPPEVNFSESPKEIAVDAVRDLRRTDHTLTRWKLQDGGKQYAVVTKYEASDWEVLVNYRQEGLGKEYYNREMGWGIRPDGSVERAESAALGSFQDNEPYDPEVIREANVSVARENESTLVLSVTDSPDASFGLTLSAGDGLYFVDKDTGHIDYVLLTPEIAGREDWVTVKNDISAYGETDVNPPSGVPTYDLATIGKDLLYGPLFPL